MRIPLIRTYHADPPYNTQFDASVNAMTTLRQTFYWFGFRFGFTRYDFFISYKHKEASLYARALERELKAKGYSCFLDVLTLGQSDKVISDESLASLLERFLKTSSSLILIGTETIFTSASPWVPWEVDQFAKKAKRLIIAIDVDQALSDSNIERTGKLEGQFGLAFENETKESLTKGRPSDHILDRVRYSFLYARKHALLRRTVVAISALFLLILFLAAMLLVIGDRNS